jgi:hypothetical protein
MRQPMHIENCARGQRDEVRHAARSRSIPCRRGGSADTFRVCGSSYVPALRVLKIDAAQLFREE